MKNKKSHPSDSKIQQIAESEIIGKVSINLGTWLKKTKLDIGTKQKIEIDGYSEKDKILCEAFAHIGELKPAQRMKVMSDILKMLLVEKLRREVWRKIIVFVDKKAAKSLQGSTLHWKIADEFNIEIMIVELERETKDAILETQKKQNMKNVDPI